MSNLKFVPAYKPEQLAQFTAPNAETNFISPIDFSDPVVKPFNKNSEVVHFYALGFLKYKIATDDTNITQSKWVALYHKVRDRIVAANMRLLNTGIYFHWKRFKDQDELLSDASFTLLRCIEMFDPWMGCKFSTYFINSINRSLYHKQDSTVNMEQEALRDMSGITEEVDKTEAEKEAYFLEEVRSIWSQQTSFLSENERYILCHRHGLEGCPELTLQEIGNTLGLCAERIRQIERQAHHKMKAVLERRLAS